MTGKYLLVQLLQDINDRKAGQIGWVIANRASDDEIIVQFSHAGKFDLQSMPRSNTKALGRID